MPESKRSYNYAGDFELVKCDFTTRDNASYDFKALIGEIHLYEDMFASSISVDMSLMDAVDIINNLDVSGGEKLTLHFVTAGMDKGIEVDLYLYKISPPIEHNTKSNVVTMHFCSEEKIKNSMIKISKSYNGIISDIVPKIISDYLDSEKTIYIDESRDRRHVVVPRWRPFYLINWLSKRAVSAEYNGAGFLFYETCDGYNFRSLDSLVDPDQSDNKPKKTLRYTQENLDAGEQTSNSFHNIKMLDIKSNTNIIEAIETGLFGATLESYDLYKKKRFVDDYSYRRDFGNFKHLEPNTKRTGIGDMYLIGTGQDYDEFLESRYTFTHLNSGAWENYKGDYARNWVNSRNTYLQSIAQIIIEATIDGDTSLHVGDKINVTLPSNSSVDANNYKNQKLSGVYLVTALRHTISKDKLQTTIELSKDTWGIPLRK